MRFGESVPMSMAVNVGWVKRTLLPPYHVPMCVTGGRDPINSVTFGEVRGIVACYWKMWAMFCYGGDVWPFKKKKPRQTCFVYCAGCRNEMCSDDSFISDTYDDNDDNHVLYRCEKCGKEADFNFDIAPVPINWADLKK